MAEFSRAKVARLESNACGATDREEFDQCEVDQNEGNSLFALRVAFGDPALLRTPALKTALLMMIAVWSFCRFYYFAFYVIEHYVEPSYRFSGLLSFALYLIQKKPSDTRAGR